MTGNRRVGVVLGAVLVSIFAPRVNAELIELTMSGNIVASNMGTFIAPNLLTVTLQYESSGSPQSIQNQQAFYADHIKYVRVVSGAYDSSASGAFGKINKHDNLAGTDGISFQAASNVATYQFGAAAAINLAPASGFTFENMFVNLGSSNGALWNNYVLPTSLNFSDFDSTRNMSFGFSGGSFFAGISNMTVVNLSVPEPSTAGLLVLVTIMAATARRRAQSRKSG